MLNETNDVEVPTGVHHKDIYDYVYTLEQIQNEETKVQ